MTSRYPPQNLVGTFRLSIVEAGFWLAVVNVANGIVGGVVGGYIADRLGVRDIRWWVWVPGIALLVAAPLCILAFNTDSVVVSMVTVTVVLALYHTWAGPVYAATQGMVGLRMRAVAVSILLFVVNLIGLGFGPPVIGAASDLLQRGFGEESLRMALMLTGPIFMLSAVLFFVSGRTLRADMDSAPE